MSSISTRGILDRLSSKAVSFVGARGRSQKTGNDDPAPLDQPTILSVRASFASATAEPSAAPSSSSRKNLVSAGTQAEPMAPPHVVVEEATVPLPPLTKKGGNVSTDVLQEAIQLVSLLETQLAVSKQENQRLRKVTEHLQSQSSKLPQLSPGKYEGRQDEVLSMAYNVLERGDTLLNGYGMSGSLRAGTHAVLEEEGEDDSEVADNNYNNSRPGVYQPRGREREVVRGRGSELQGGGSSCDKSLISRPGRDRSRSLSTDRNRERVSLSRRQNEYTETRGRSMRDERRPRDRSTSCSQSVERRQQQHKQAQQRQPGRKEGSRNQQARLEDEYEQARERRMHRSQAQGRRGRNGVGDDDDDDDDEGAVVKDGEDEEDERVWTRWVRLGTYQTFKAVQDAKRLRVRKTMAPPGRNVTRRIILPSSVGDWPTVLHYKSSKVDRPSPSLRGSGRRYQIRFDRARGQWVLEGEERWGRGRSRVYGGSASDMTRDDCASPPPRYAVAAAPRISAIPPSFSTDDDYAAPPKSGPPNPSYQDLLDRLYSTVNEMRNAAGAPSAPDVDEDRAPAARRHVGRAPQLNGKGELPRFGHAKMRDLGY